MMPSFYSADMPKNAKRGKLAELLSSASKAEVILWGEFLLSSQFLSITALNY